MSGFEIAGIVLAAVPILIKGLALYKESLDPTRTILGYSGKRYKLKISRLRLALAGQRVIINQQLLKLIAYASPESNLQELPNKHNALLWTGHIGTKVKSFLDSSGAYETFIETLQAYYDCLEEIAGSFVDFFQSPMGNSISLIEILESNEAGRAVSNLQKRVKFVMNEKNLDELLGTMKELGTTLKSLIDDGDDIYRIRISSKLDIQDEQRKQVLISLHNSRKHANRLFKALTHGWKRFCDEDHYTLLCLRPQQIRIPLQVCDDFMVLISWYHNTPVDQRMWHQACIIVQEEFKTQSSNEFNTKIGSSLVETASSSNQSLQGREVEHICKHLAEAKPGCLFLSADSKFFPSSAQSDTVDLTETSQGMKSLASFLEENKRIEPEDRVKLAVMISVSVLQYNLTPWFKEGLGKDVLLFMEKERAETGIEVAYPFLKNFVTQNTVRTQPEDDPEFTMLELGILLLELWTLQAFEDWLQTAGLLDNTVTKDRHFRLRCSVLWFQSLKGKLLPSYRKVVGVCLRPAVFDLINNISWEDDEFREAFYEEIITPLAGLIIS